jgi:hypothetical protein
MNTLACEGGATIACGSRTFRFDVVGATIGEIRGRLGTLLGIRPGSMALVNGVAVGDDRVVGVVDKDVEFVKEAGRLG